MKKKKWILVITSILMMLLKTGSTVCSAVESEESKNLEA